MTVHSTAQNSSDNLPPYHPAQMMSNGGEGWHLQPNQQQWTPSMDH